jgi:hypothetical protein
LGLAAADIESPKGPEVGYIKKGRGVQVGRDEDATKFLGKLDCDSKIGGMVDATSYIELEQEEFKKKGIDLTVDV